MRGEIRELSRASRRRLLRYFNSIDRGRIGYIPLFITLTYPENYPVDKETYKEHLKSWLRRMQRKYGRFGAIWRLEFQRRGAPHFHLIVFLDKPPAQLYEFVSRSWYEVCGTGDPNHLRAGTNVSRRDSWRSLTGYLSKYVAKVEQLAPGVESPGRFWGIRDKHLIPVCWIRIPVSWQQAFFVRRILRKYAGLKVYNARKLYSLSSFVGFETMTRLLSWLGIIGSDGTGGLRQRRLTLSAASGGGRQTGHR